MHTKHIVQLTLAAVFGLSTALSACLVPFSEPNENHCWFADGNMTCDGLGMGRPFCVGPGDGCNSDNGFGGCVAELPDPACYSPCGGEKFASEDSTCDPVAEGDGDGDSTGDGDGEGDGDGDGDGDTACRGPEDCTDPGTPFCDMDSGECVSCDATADPDTSCASADSSMPVCLDGSCVQCTQGKDDACGGTTPICDAGASVCVGCSDHSQCPDSACNLVDGNCFDPASLIYVDGDASCQDGNGTESTPYCNMTTAISAAGTEAVIMLHETTDILEYPESVTIAKPIAIFAVGDEEPTVRGQNLPAFTVSGNGKLFMRGVRVADTPDSVNGQGVRVMGGVAWIEQSRIVNNTGGGIVVDGGGTLVLENSFVSGSASSPALSVDSGTFEVLYSTLGLPPSLGGPTLACTDSTGSSVRNSIITSTDDADEVQCTDLAITNSALEMVYGDNVALGELDINWFGNYLNGNYSLSGTQPPDINTAAKWQTGDPATDIDGTPRPTTDGSLDYAGADRP